MSGTPATARGIFEAAIEIRSPEERRVFVDRACAGDNQLQLRVDRLLLAHASLDKCLPEEPRTMPTDATRHPQAGDRIGRYRLLEVIGEGGFGVVYRAEQLEPVSRVVALKLIKPGMDTRQVIARFEAERQALAWMDHPNIARAFDGGASESGRPFFVMEWVNGKPITDYCRELNLSVDRRLALFIQVCRAVHHAHQKGTIHRDLKPSNILVTTDHGETSQGTPKVIDFGVAKATGSEAPIGTQITQADVFIGTPAYMSPEQASQGGRDLDTRSDIYSLGVLLYELLTGRPPFDRRELLESGYDEMRRIIREKEPARPSVCLRESTRGNPRGLPRRSRSIDPDLDWIVMKCLEKDRRRRYETANDLAADIERHLAGEPVIARAPSRLYRISKAVRRNKLAVASAVAILSTLLAGTGATSWQAIRAARERDRAERRLQASLRFVNSIFTSVSPAVNQIIGAAQANRALAASGRELMNELLRDTDTNLANRLALGALQVQLAWTQGWVVGNTTADYEEGMTSALGAIPLLTPRTGEIAGRHQLVFIAEAEMLAGYDSLALLRYDEATAHFHRMAHWCRELSHAPSPDAALQGQTMLAWAEGCLGEVLLARSPADAQTALEQYFGPAVSMYRPRYDSGTLTNRNELGGFQGALDAVGRIHFQLGRYSEALPSFRDALQIAQTLALERPNGAQQAAQVSESGAKLGAVLLILGLRDEGSRRLDTALEQAMSLKARDPHNVGFKQNHIRVLAYATIGKAAWSTNPACIDEERPHSLAAAAAHLDEAQRLASALTPVVARNLLRFEMDAAAAALNSVRNARSP